MIRRFFILLVACLTVPVCLLGADVRREVDFPEIPGYQTLVLDPHMHTVFSDGNVWPTVRVDEAWRQGLDAIAISDHIEYQPHKEDVPTNHNRPFELAIGQARARNILLTRAAEITRDTPPGHFNALFLKDVNPLDTPDFLECVQQANEQGAFVFWNHQAWKGEEKGQWLDVHTTLYENKWLHGMEVCNGETYYPSAHQWCLDKNLTMIGSSDIHQPDLRRESTTEDHRTLTLVFAEARTLDALQESLHAGRTVVWYKDQLIGRKQWLEPLFHASVQIAPPHLRAKNYLALEVHNSSDADLHLVRSGPVGPAEIVLPAHSTDILRVNTNQPDQPLEIRYTVANFLVAPETPLEVVLKIAGP
jgi:hypothetical protein